MPKILVKTGDTKGFVWRLGNQEIYIGRNPSNTIVLPDRRVSRRHAKIAPQDQDNEYVIEDLGSTNGTIVNESLVTKKVLRIGDIIRLGATILEFLPISAPEELEVASKTAQVKMIPEEQTPAGLTVEMTILPEKVSPKEIEVVKPDVKALLRAYQRLMVLYRISYDLGMLMELSKLLDRILELVLEIIKADRGFIMLIDEETKELLPQAVRRRKGLEDDGEITVSKTIINQVLKTGESVLTSDAMQDVRFKDAESVVLQGIHSAMCVPIKTREKILGIMQVDTKAAVLGFTKEDLELLTAVCNQAAIVVENAKLFNDLKKANQELRDRQAQLIESEKMAALGQLASGVAHEINNPLTSIISYAELTAERLSEGRISPPELEKCIEFLNIVQVEGHRCQKVAQNLLQFAWRKKVVMAPTDMTRTIDTALVVAQYHMRKANIQLIKNIEPNLPRIMAEEDQLQQVFLNLIINAKDAMEKGGTLTIDVRKFQDRWIEVKFIDTGYGIPEDKLEEIFKPLYTTKEEGKGTGLGLTISREIIERHNGTIEVESTVNKGSTFTVRLPINP